MTRTILTPISNPVIPVTPLESLANRDHPKATSFRSETSGFFGQKISKQIDAITRPLLRILNDE